MAVAQLVKKPFESSVRSIEVVGNKLPHPLYLFIWLFAIIAVVSTVLHWTGAATVVPGDDERIPVRGFFTSDGLLWFLENFPQNFITFPPLVTVILMMLAVGLAERTGLIHATIMATFSHVPRRLVPYAVAITATQAHVMSDVAMIVVPTLAALVFQKTGRNPIAGFICAVACVAAGYSGGFTIGALDTLLAGLTQQATEIVPNADVDTSLLMNYYFTACSGIVLGVLGGFITDKLLEPRCPAPVAGSEQPVGAEDSAESSESAHAASTRQELGLHAAERRGLIWAALSLLVFWTTLITAWIWPGSPLQGDGGTLIPSPLLSGMIVIIFASFVLCSLVYGVSSGSLKNKQQLPEMLTETARGVAPYLVLVFAISQALALFTWTNVGTLLAVRMSESFEAIGLTGFGAVIVFIIVTMLLNLLIGSGSAQWALLAPVFVPGFMLLGLSPMMTQAAYRIGDSVTNALTPMNAMLLVALTMLHRWEPDLKLGTLFSRNALFVFPFLGVWVAVLAAFYFLDLPLGPGAPIHME